MDVYQYNRGAWDQACREGNRWSIPVSPEQIAAARGGEIDVVLTPLRPVPRDWFPEPFAGTDLLGLACGGGQQGPLFAAAGARVTTLDASPAQLGQDRLVAEREGLDLRTVEGDMRDLPFDDASFDLVFFPVASLFVPDVLPVWREAARVLRPGGALLAGFVNPLYFLFDDAALAHGEMVVRYRIPYSDPRDCDPEQLAGLRERNEPLCFGHSLEDLIGGQLAAGLQITAFVEDRWDGEEKILDRHIATFMATRAVKVR